MSRSFDIAVIGANSAVGEALLDQISERRFPYQQVYAVALTASKGDTVPFAGDELDVEALEDFDFSKAQIAFFALGAETAARFAAKAWSQNCVVIDTSPEFRHSVGVPMVLAAINLDCVAQYAQHGIIATPSGLSCQMLTVLKPIFDAVGISRINAASYQAVSILGKAAIEELARHTASMLNFQSFEPITVAKQLAFNVIGQVGALHENGYSDEEMSLHIETQRLFGDSQIYINATSAMVPVFYGDSLALHIETRQPITVEQVQKLLSDTAAVVVVDAGSAAGIPTAVTEASGHDSVFVSRIRRDLSHPLGLNLWIVADNLRMGVARNAVQIAERLAIQHL